MLYLDTIITSGNVPRTISYRIVSYRIVSYRIVLYRIVCYSGILTLRLFSFFLNNCNQEDLLAIKKLTLDIVEINL